MMSEQEMKDMEQYALGILKNNPTKKWVNVLQTEKGSIVVSFDDLTGEDTATELKKCRETCVKRFVCVCDRGVCPPCAGIRDLLLKLDSRNALTEVIGQGWDSLQVRTLECFIPAKNGKTESISSQ